MIVSASGGRAPYKYILNGYTYNTGNFPQRSAGTYELTVKDADGESVKTTIVLENNLAPPVIKIKSYTHTSACDAADASFTLEASGGTPPYEYSMDRVNFQGSNIFSGLTGGYYTFFVRDANGCIKSIKSPTSWNRYCLPSASSNNSVGACGNEAYITLQETFDSNRPLQFSIDGINYSSTGEFYQLTSGIHRIYIKDAAGKITIYAFTILQSCSLDIRFISTEAECMANDGSLTVNVANGAPPYQYSIDGVNYQSGNVFTGLASGEYIVTVKDNNGTTIAGNGSVYDKCPLVQGTPTHVTCAGNDGMVAATATKGTPPYQFSIDGSNFQSSGTFTGLVAGNYSLTVKDSKGHTHTRQIVVNNTCLNITPSVVQPSCGMSNGSITVSAGNGTTPYRYSIDGINFQANDKFVALKQGSYTITVQDALGKKGSTIVSLSDIAGPDMNITVKPRSCNLNDGEITVSVVNGTGPYQYSLNGTNYQGQPVFSHKAEGNYTVWVRDANGCTSSQSVEITQSCPALALIVDNEMCRNSQGKIEINPSQGTAPYQYAIDQSSFQLSNVFQNLTAGNYTVYVKDALGVTVSKDTIIVDNCPVVTAIVTDGLCGSDKAGIKVTGQKGKSPYNYSIDGSNFQAGDTFDGLPDGKYTITIRDAENNVNTTEVTVANYPGPVVSFDANAATCLNNDGIITLNTQGGTAPFVYSIDGNNYQSNNKIVGLTAGDHTTYVKDANGCVIKTAVTVDSVNNLQLTANSAQQICEGEQTQLKVQSNGYTFQWSPQTELNNHLVKEPVASAVYTTWYYVTASLGLCSLKDSVLLSVLPAPRPVVSNDTTICYGQSVQLRASGGERYIWTPATFLDNSHTSSPLVLQPSNSISYRLSVIDENNCSSLEETKVTISVTPPAGVFAGRDTSIVMNQPFRLNALDVNQSGFTQYKWFPDIGLDFSSKPDPLVLTDRDMTYYVTASTPAGCKGSDTINLKVYRGPEIYVPSAFTPDRNGKNDILRAIPVGIKQFKYFAIFDRWGKRVFFTTDYRLGWDGTVANQPLSVGTFAFQTEGIDAMGNTVFRQGTVTLIR